jgi:hypothetical protein
MQVRAIHVEGEKLEKITEAGFKRIQHVLLYMG